MVGLLFSMPVAKRNCGPMRVGMERRLQPTLVGGKERSRIGQLTPFAGRMLRRCPVRRRSRRTGLRARRVESTWRYYSGDNQSDGSAVGLRGLVFNYQIF